MANFKDYLATAGNGLPARILPTPDTSQQRVLSVNTTGSSCATNTYSVVDPARRLEDTYGQATETFSRLTRGGNLPVCGSPNLSLDRITSEMTQPIDRGPDRESVWDYPRPPALEACPRHIQIVIAGQTLADTRNSYRVLETSHPPVYYLPTKDIAMDRLKKTHGGSFCEWKGYASYFAYLSDGIEIADLAWCYSRPTQRFEAIKDHLAFYPHKTECCYVDGEKVMPQEGNFYGGWITEDIVGPFKGGPGTLGW